MLTDAQIRGARPREKSYRIADGLGLTLVVNPDGSKFWRFRYRFASVEKCLSFGRYAMCRSLMRATAETWRASCLLPARTLVGIFSVVAVVLAAVGI